MRKATYKEKDNNRSHVNHERFLVPPAAAASQTDQKRQKQLKQIGGRLPTYKQDYSDNVYKHINTKDHTTQKPNDKPESHKKQKRDKRPATHTSTTSNQQISSKSPLCC